MATRDIKTVYYDHNGEPLRTNSAVHASSAIFWAMAHMHRNDYGAAWSAEVYDNVTTVLYAVIQRGTSELKIIYKRPECNPWLPKGLLEYALASHAAETALQALAPSPARRDAVASL